ncbi:sirohydrochlorin chelatase [Cohnella phaseoli]|uniref:Sirohydrochlorin ferrochelatase n=1 Tax=Cohnella phaseoli TaxID=456490 RepID=A0A3D9HSL7_9BACL|nr:CbiX/SirB N-terminal domain-containing protein [Cohnella phaseoli]RED51856.1 sirohydrochlorin ferrochelatase [Cohnella phaseoli]
MEKRGLLVISHGSREHGWIALVDETIEAVRSQLGTELVVEAVFLELVDGRLIQDGINRLLAEGVTEALVLPLFVSSGSTHVDEIGWALGVYPEARTATELEPFELGGLCINYGQPMGEAAEIDSIVLDRLMRLSEEPSEEQVLLIGHGSEEAGFRESWERELSGIAERVRVRAGFHAASIALLLPSQVAERIDTIRRDRPDLRILAVGLFLSEGYFTKTVIPRHLASSGGLEVCRYDGAALMPHPQVAAWVVRQAREWLEIRERGLEREVGN